MASHINHTVCIKHIPPSEVSKLSLQYNLLPYWYWPDEEGNSSDLYHLGNDQLQILNTCNIIYFENLIFY